MRIDVAYGDTTQPVEIPDRNLQGILEPIDCCEFGDPAASLEHAAGDCAVVTAAAHRVLVLVNDYTRPTPNAPVLAALAPALEGKDVRYLVCAGTHRPPTDAEYRTIFGSAFYDANRDRITCHDSKDKTNLFFLGKTSFGTDLWLNRELIHADAVITINSIEPHYFAGYTGGRKGILPGIAGYETIAHNHNMVTRRGSHTFGLAGNPVHEDMTEATRMVQRPIFSIQLVQDRNHRLLSVHHGDIISSFESACRDAHQVFAVPIKAKADIVLSVLRPPCDINYYQSQRAAEFAMPALAAPSVQITVSACRDGVGNDSFVRVFKGCKNPDELLAPRLASAAFDAHSVLGWHKSARLAQIMKTTELYTVMGVDDAIIRTAFMKPFKTVQTALDTALDRIGPAARVYVIPDAGSVVPVLTSA